MSMEDWKVKLEAAADASDDPALEGVVKVARAVEKGQRETDARLSNFEAKIDETQKKTAEAIGRVDTKIEALGKQVVDELDAMKTRGLAIGLLSGSVDPSRELLNAIPDADRKFVVHQDRIGSSAADKGKFADPIFRGASEAWFRHATMAQMSKYGADRQKHVDTVVKLGTAMNDIYAKAAYSPTDANGGYGIPDPVEAEVLRLVYDSSTALQIFRQIPMSGDTLYVPNEFGAFTVYWSAAAATLTGGENTFSRNTLLAQKVIGRATAASEAVDDIVFNLLGYVREVMAEQIGYTIDAKMFEATATPFTNSVNADISTSGNTIATTTTDGEALVYSDLAKAVYKAKYASTRQNAAFVMAPAVWSTIVALSDTTGAPVFQYANVPGTPPERILGFPAYLCAALSVAITRGSTANCGNVYFGPWKKALVGVRKGLAWSVTDQVNWATDSIDMRMIGRFGFTLGVPAAFTRIVGCLTT